MATVEAPTTDEYVPAGHSKQVLEFEEPMASEYLPAAQSLHTISAFQEALKPMYSFQSSLDVNVTNRVVDENVDEPQNALLFAQSPDIFCSRVLEVQVASTQLKTNTKS
jgi:hypothetical protein